MKFHLNLMYKNIYKDKDMAFIIDEIISQNSNGAQLVVTWYKLTDKNKYISVGINGDFFIPKDQILYYMEI